MTLLGRSAGAARLLRHLQGFPAQDRAAVIYWNSCKR